MESVNVGLGEDRPVLFKMLLAAVSETVNVVGQSAFTSHDRHRQHVGQDAVENLPTIARSIGDGGSTPSSTRRSPTTETPSCRLPAYNSNNLQIDGAVNNDLFGLQAPAADRPGRSRSAWTRSGTAAGGVAERRAGRVAGAA
jgi:hypothetical protein